MRRGSVSERSIKCGKLGCACNKDPKARHGPYYSLTQAVAGKTRSRFLTAEQAAVAQQQIASGCKFREQLDTYWEACEEAEVPKKGSGQGSKTTSSSKSKRA